MTTPAEYPGVDPVRGGRRGRRPERIRVLDDSARTAWGMGRARRTGYLRMRFEAEA